MKQNNGRDDPDVYGVEREVQLDQLNIGCARGLTISTRLAMRKAPVPRRSPGNIFCIFEAVLYCLS